MTIERRINSVAELKFATDGDAMTFEGYASVFDGIDSYGDRIRKGAYRETLAEHRAAGRLPPMLSQHGSFVGGDANMPIGVWKSMEEDDRGRRVRGELAPTPRGKEAHTLLKMGALSGLSIGFVPVAWESRAKPEDPRRTLTKISLVEVSLVTTPADPKARVTSVKAAIEMTIREFEEALERGTLPPLTARDAKALLAAGFKAMTSARDAGDEKSATHGDLAEILRRNVAILKSR
jgi:HK97 family phage prohead protease